MKMADIHFFVFKKPIFPEMQGRIESIILQHYWKSLYFPSGLVEQRRIWGHLLHGITDVMRSIVSFQPKKVLCFSVSNLLLGSKPLDWSRDMIYLDRLLMFSFKRWVCGIESVQFSLDKANIRDRHALALENLSSSQWYVGTLQFWRKWKELTWQPIRGNLRKLFKHIFLLIILRTSISSILNVPLHIFI